ILMKVLVLLIITISTSSSNISTQQKSEISKWGIGLLSRWPFTIPIWTKHTTPYKEYFWGFSYGIVWYSKTKSSKYKNLKIGYLSFIYNPIGVFLNNYNLPFTYIKTTLIINIIVALIPFNFAFLNIKYKSLEMSFLSLWNIYDGLYDAINYFIKSGKACNDLLWSFIICALYICFPERISIDFSYFKHQ
ncbi:MAG: hypothetical protein II393_03730, partial [Cytophagales bacterium]|nr:hypothetical protein [Cytophagales bacterium]